MSSYRPPRLAGLRSGTHGGARAGRGACKPPQHRTARHTPNHPNRLVGEMSSYRPPRLAGLRSGTHGGARAGRGACNPPTTQNGLANPQPPLLSCRRNIVLPDSDPEPTAGLGTGAAPATPHNAKRPGKPPTTPTVLSAKCRLAGPRSGTHGGARDGRGAATHHNAERPGTPGHPPNSSYRTPIRYPRWGTGRARQPPPTHNRQATPLLPNHSYGRLLWAPDGGARAGRGNPQLPLIPTAIGHENSRFFPRLRYSLLHDSEQPGTGAAGHPDLRRH